MTAKTFVKILSANDVGVARGHMAGILVPRKDRQLLAFLPYLDPGVKNPSVWLDCVTTDCQTLRLRYIYYNNRLHDPNGTRNEYRITWLTRFLRESGAKERDIFEISKADNADRYQIRIIPITEETEPDVDDNAPVRIKLTTPWRRVD